MPDVIVMFRGEKFMRSTLEKVKAFLAKQGFVRPRDMAGRGRSSTSTNRAILRKLERLGALQRRRTMDETSGRYEAYYYPGRSIVYAPIGPGGKKPRRQTARYEEIVEFELQKSGSITARKLARYVGRRQKAAAAWLERNIGRLGLKKERGKGKGAPTVYFREN